MKEESTNSKMQGFSRRKFLRGAGITTAGSVLLNTGLLAGSSTPANETGMYVGPGPVTVQIEVNGQMETLAIEPRTTLASALRDHLSDRRRVCSWHGCIERVFHHHVIRQSGLSGRTTAGVDAFRAVAARCVCAGIL